MAMQQVNVALAEIFYQDALDNQDASWLIAVRQNCLTQMTSGDIQALSSVTANGKTMQLTTSMTLVEVFMSASKALTWFNQGRVTNTIPDFTNLCH